MSFLLTKPQQKGIMLLHDLTIDEAKKIRKKFQLKNRIIKSMKKEGNKHNESSVIEFNAL